jgi:hypothetical protein
MKSDFLDKILLCNVFEKWIYSTFLFSNNLMGISKDYFKFKILTLSNEQY